ncbi:hypothetical protein Moror_16809 [Moniliophthora roreri MCA 2997]|uniref:Protein kinase domain-containing protein n=2 Tax=Moniliophthora roreri TaxID=221103 RepID=V2XAG9_MONRO|nr:hypothetical protein Moror_16809 [Moniliophthora roreri MCA 2997]
MASTIASDVEDLNARVTREILRSDDSSLALLIPSNAGKEYVLALIELLQAEIDDCSPTDGRHRKKCIKYLKALATKYRVLPQALFVENIARDGDHPLRGGGYAASSDGHRPLCLKVLRMFTENDEAARGKIFLDFCQEALIWKQLKHPNIVPFLGVNTKIFAPGFCLVSPWMVNGDVVSFVKAFPAFDKLVLIHEISSAPDYLHSLEPAIVHGDIKGANILITNDLHCCLADFGLAIAAESQSLVSSSSGTPKGSFRWLAPELISSGQAPVSARTRKKPQRDIYAFACTVLEIITGRPPFADLSDGAVLLKVIQGDRPERPASGWCPDSIWDLVEQCWEQDPRKRPFARTLYEHLGGLIRERELSIGGRLLPRRPGLEEPREDIDDNDDPLLEFFPPA